MGFSVWNTISGLLEYIKWDTIWNRWNSVILIAELVMILLGIVFIVARKNNSVKSVIFAILVFFLNLGLYIAPWLYRIIELKKSENVVMRILESISATILQFVGEVNVNLVEEYAEVFPVYNVLFFTGAALAIIITFSTALALFGKKFINNIRMIWRLHRRNCDIVIGNSEAALDYARNNKKTVIAIDPSRKDCVKGLMKEGYVVFEKDFSMELLKSRMFNKKTRYNFIYPNEKDTFFDDIKIILSYLEQKKVKNYHFYIELDETAEEAIRKQIEEKDKKMPEGRKLFRERITVFSRNELMARLFVDRYPITKYMDKDFYNEDTSVKEDKSIKVFMLGFGKMSREIYRQFVMNNQLATRITDDGKTEYRVLPVKYHIYGAELNEYELMLKGLETEFAKITNNGDYFPLPDMPYTVECSEENFGVDGISDICEAAKDSDLSYIIVDTGDIYQSMDVGKRIVRVLGGEGNVHIFVRNDSLEIDETGRFTGYGDLGDVFNHEVIVNEKLILLAKEINKAYLKMRMSFGNKLTEEQKKKLLDEANEKDWRGLGYFGMYSNIYTANNLRLKLNLLGFDYLPDGKGEGIDQLEKKIAEIEECTKDGGRYGSCLELNLRSALLAQEHFRWNAYHLLNEFLPMGKSWISIKEETNNNNSKDEKKSLYRKICESVKGYFKKFKKDNPEAAIRINPGRKKIKFNNKNDSDDARRHACLTTFSGLNQLSEFFADKANKIAGQSDEYKAADYDYYSGDSMIYDIVCGFLRENGWSVEKIR